MREQGVKQHEKLNCNPKHTLYES